MPEKAIGLDVYNISLDKSEATEAVEMTSVRLLNTSGNDKVSVFGFDGKDWCEASYKVNGQYLIISEPDSFGSYIIIPDGINTVLIALICAAAVVLAAAALVIFRKKQK